MALEQTILYIIFGTLLAIVYSLRILVLLERRIARMDENLLRITDKIIIEERKIQAAISKKTFKRKPSKSKSRKKKK